jgi:hypothetical protein
LFQDGAFGGLPARYGLCSCWGLNRYLQVLFQSWTHPVVFGVCKFGSAFVDNADRFPEGAEEVSDDETDILVTSYFDDNGKRLVFDQRYAVSANSMSALILKASSPFFQELLAVQKTTEYVEGPWKNGRDGILERVVTYMKAATKMIKAVKATETHTCRRIDNKGFVLNVSCSTPDVPMGSNFLVELQVRPFNHVTWGANKVAADAVSFCMKMSVVSTSIRE